MTLHVGETEVRILHPGVAHTTGDSIVWLPEQRIVFTVVPGHGPLTDPGAYEATERYLRYVAELAREGRAKGLTPLEAAREADLGEFAAWRESERLVANLHRAYAELAGEPEGVPLHILAVLRDMTVMNGGTPIPCHA